MMLALARSPRVLNVGLRLVTMASSFGLTFALARFLAPAEFGLYGLFIATVAASIYAVGLDFYTFSTRELIRADRSQWAMFIRSHAALAVVLYAVVVPLLMLLFAFGLLPWSLALWLVTLLVIEHLSREVSRLLIAMGQPLPATMMMFVRKAVWAWCLLALLVAVPASRQLQWVLATWFIAGVIACAMGIVRLRRLGINMRARVDWGWIRRGVKISTGLLIATFAVQCLTSVDRYVMQHVAGRDVLGAYVLFGGLAVAMASILDAGVFSFAYPRMVEAHHRGQVERFNRELRRMAASCLVVCVGVSLALWIGIDPLLSWVGKDVFVVHKNMLPWVLLATSLNCISYAPHYALYAQGRDRAIIAASILGLVVFAVFLIMLRESWQALAVPMALSGAFASILFAKSWAYLRGDSARSRSASAVPPPSQ